LLRPSIVDRTLNIDRGELAFAISASPRPRADATMPPTDCVMRITVPLSSGVHWHWLPPSLRLHWSSKATRIAIPGWV